jgi:hypothetical protein
MSARQQCLELMVRHYSSESLKQVVSKHRQEIFQHNLLVHQYHTACRRPRSKLLLQAQQQIREENNLLERIQSFNGLPVSLLRRPWDTVGWVCHGLAGKARKHASGGGVGVAGHGGDDGDDKAERTRGGRDWQEGEELENEMDGGSYERWAEKKRAHREEQGEGVGGSGTSGGSRGTEVGTGPRLANSKFDKYDEDVVNLNDSGTDSGSSDSGSSASSSDDDGLNTTTGASTKHKNRNRPALFGYVPLSVFERIQNQKVQQLQYQYSFLGLPLPVARAVHVLSALGFGPMSKKFTGEETLELLEGDGGQGKSKNSSPLQSSSGRIRGRGKKERASNSNSSNSSAGASASSSSKNLERLYASAEWKRMHNFNWEFLRGECHC